MKNFFQRTIAHNSGDWFWISLILLFSFLFFSSFVTNTVETAAVPTVINYQGKLLENNLLSTTTKSMGFLIYTASSGGTLLYSAAGSLVATSTVNVTPSQGIFSVDLGGAGTNALNTSTFSNNTNLYLEVWIEGTPLSPRKRLTATPFAINSQLLLGISATTTSSGVYIPHSDANGNFQFTGTPQSSAVSGGVIYVNPGSADADETLFGLAVAGSEKFRVDAEGDAWISGTSTIQNINVLDGIVLGGVKHTTWPSGGDVTAAGNNTFTGLNTFSVTTTLATTTVNGALNVTGTSTFSNRVNVPGKLSAPLLVGSLVDGTGGALLGGAAGLVVNGDYAYVAAGSDTAFQVVNVSNPRNPTPVASLSDGIGGAMLNNPQGVTVSGNYAYVASRFTDAMEIIDISNPSNPKHAGKISNGEGGASIDDPYHIFISGSYAYVASYEGDALEIIDISNPSNPKHAGKIVDGSGGASLNGAFSVYVSGNYAYVVSYNANALEIIDVADPAHPYHVGSLTHGSGGALLDTPRSVFVSGNFAYVASSGSNALEIINISNPASPFHVGSLVSGGAALLSGASEVIVSGDYAYVAAALSNGLEVVDISSSTNPVHFSSVTNANLNGANGLALVGNYAYVTGNAVGVLEVIDVSGAQIGNVSIGSGRLSNLNVDNSAKINGDLYIKNGLQIGNNGLSIGGDISLFSNTSSAFSTNTFAFSHTSLFRSSAASTNKNLFIFDTVNTFAHAASTTYLMSVRNNGLKAFSVSSNGDVAASGTLYASSAAIGTPGSPGDLAERVDIATDDTVEPGDVVVVDSTGTDTYRRSSVPYEQGVAGVISTNPSLVIGYGKTQNTAVMAMVGRVPIKVSTENGPIMRGDILVTASSTGYAMRYDATKDDDSKVVGIVGVALESLDEGSGKIMGLVRTGWVNSRHKTIADIQQELVELAEANNVGAGDANVLNVAENGGQLTFLAGDVNANGFSILNIKRLVGNNGMWEVDEDGRFISRLETSEGRKSLYSLQTDENEYIFSGSSHLQLGVARVDFDPLVKEIIDGEKPMKINITLTSEALGVYINAKDATGFVVKELQNGQSNAEFDYVVIAKRKGKADPASQPEVQPQGGSSDQPPANENPPAQNDNNNAGEEQNPSPQDPAQENPPQEQAPADNSNNSPPQEQNNPPPEEAPADAPPAEG